MNSYIVYGKQTREGYWIVWADSLEEAEKAHPEPFDGVPELIDWEVKFVEENS